MLLMAAWVNYRRRKRRDETDQKDGIYLDNKAELPGQPRNASFPKAAELGPDGELIEGADTGRPHQADANPRAELEGDWRGHEAP